MDAREEERRAAVARARRDRADVQREIEAGQRPGLPDMTDEEVGLEAVRLVKESRKRRGSENRSKDRLPWDLVVSRDPKVHSGDLVFRGSRVPLETLIDHLKGGHSIEEYLDGYPSVQRWQVETFLDLAVAAADPLSR